MLTLDIAIYDEFTGACRSRGRKYSDVLETLISEYADKIKAENAKREELRQQEERLKDSEGLIPILKCRISDTQHRINSGQVTGFDLEREQKRLAEAQKQLEELTQAVARGITV